MYKFTIPASSFDEVNIDKQMIRGLVSKHMAMIPRFKKLLDYYKGEHQILQDDDRQNKLVCNHAKDIADTSSSYFIGNPVSYESKDDDIEQLTDALENAGADECDGDNGLDLAIYGVAYEYDYAKANETTLTCKNISAENTFMVYDDTIEENELFAVYYYVRKNDSEVNAERVIIATVLTNNYRYDLTIYDNDDYQATTEEAIPHFMGEVPVICYQNNKLCIGDYELQIPLIDAYNALMSDRVTDKEQFIDSILALYGTLLGDEMEDGSEDPMEELKRKKLLELPDGTKAEYITRTFDENGVEVLKKAIEQDIHKFSHVPCMTDEAFGGNVSGVAMEFKLLGLENITKIKSRYYRKGLRKRLRLFCNYLSKKSVYIDPAGITPTFTRALPKNLLELSQIVANLKGTVSTKTLLSLLPFVNDPEEEMEAVKAESEENAKQQQALFGNMPNTPPEDIEVVDKEEKEDVNE